MSDEKHIRYPVIPFPVIFAAESCFITVLGLGKMRQLVSPSTAENVHLKTEKG